MGILKSYFYYESTKDDSKVEAAIRQKAEATNDGFWKIFRLIFYRKSCASVMPDHKQACVGRNSRLVDFCHCFTFWGLRNDREPSAA